MLEEILRRRSFLVSFMPEYALTFLPRYNTPGTKLRCCAPVPLNQCDMMILGSTLKEFQSLGIQPTYEGLLLKSVNDSYSIFKGIKIHFWQTPKGGPCKPQTYDPTQCKNHSNVKHCSAGLISHKSTCSFVPELIRGLETVVSRTGGLSLHEFHSRQAYVTPLTDSKWESMEYICT